jgi:hypothetical protein
MHLVETAAALAHVARLLKPGGLIGAREAAKEGDWFSGPNAGAAKSVNDIMIAQIQEAGADPFIGKRLGTLFADAGLERVEVAPTYSTTFSARVIANFFGQRLREPDFTGWAIARGLETRESLEHLMRDLERWGESPASIAAICECTALGWKRAN